MIVQGDIVTPKQTYSRVVNPDMAAWIVANAGRRFYVLDVTETSARLKGVTFAVTFDLLEKL